MKMIKRFFKFCIKIIFWLFVFSIAIVILYKWVPVPITPLMLIRNVEQIQSNKKIILKHDWVPIEEISKNLQIAVICSEDQNFLIHNGFDVEVYFTFLIELFWSKERIMEVYLNSIEMGNGIYGVEEASKYWFKKPAIKLNRNEAAAIAAILPNPLRFKANPATNYIQRRKNWIVRQMNFYGPLNYDD